jgi:aryl-alcohol dehydrogenase-like predicted oxidoreductase
MNLGMTVYNPLAGGLLVGKHSREAGPEAGTRFALNEQYFGRYWQDANFEAVAQLRKIAGQAGITLTQLAIRWLVAQEPVTSVILGVSKIEHLEENLQAADGALDAATLEACDQVWQGLRGGHFKYNR